MKETLPTILPQLFALQDKEYAVFQSKLIPTVERDTIIGVRTPALKKLAKKLAGSKEAESFLHTLPHTYFEENQLHAFIISGTKDFASCISELDRFLPNVDNWATCDQLSPFSFARNKKALLPHIRKWLASRHTYTVRFGMGTLMRYFLNDDFHPSYLTWVTAVQSEEYYIRMMQAWYLATALAKQWQATIPLIEGKRLDPWTNNKTIQKAVESFRITSEQKDYLKRLKI